MKLTLEQEYMLSVLHSQYYVCWCSGDFRSQGISRHGIDPTKSEYFISSIWRVNADQWHKMQYLFKVLQNNSLLLISDHFLLPLLSIFISPPPISVISWNQLVYQKSHFNEHKMWLWCVHWYNLSYQNNNTVIYWDVSFTTCMRLDLLT